MALEQMFHDKIKRVKKNSVTKQSEKAMELVFYDELAKKLGLFQINLGVKDE
jgi:hypothetical protein